MFPVVQIGPASIQTPGLLLIIGVWIGLSLCEKFSRDFQVDPDKIYRLALTTIASGIMGARLGYIIRYSHIFSANPVDIFSLNPQLLDPSAGLLFAGMGGLIFIQRSRMEIWKTLDGLTPAFVTIIISISLANLASGDAYGSPTNLPWGIFLWGEMRHPSQILETVGSILILLFILPLRNRQSGIATLYPGLVFLRLIIFSSVARVFFEAFRGESVLILGNMRIAQVIAWIILAFALYLYFLRSPKQGNDHQSGRSDET